MNESARTITYVVVAFVAVALALVLNPPREITPESLTKANVGKEFYPDFKPGEATSIRVVAFDEAKAESRTFGVKLENGNWTIPTRHNYPADGADRLSKTATSVRRIKREELASTSPENQEQLGVIDPLDKDPTKLKGRGQRITLTKGDTTLVDLIIGKQLKDRPGFFYIRKPDEQATYVAKVSIDLSTKFADWVETDLLKLDRNDLTEMEVVMNFEIQSANGRPKVAAGETNTLVRDKPADPWKLAGLEAGEEVDVAKVNAAVTTLDDLKLVGVRPKPKGFKPDLTFDRDFVKKQSDLDELVLEMRVRGFELVPDRESKTLKMYGDAGELTAGTNKGIVYTLKFGSVFLGDETEIEVGAAADKEKAEEKPKDDAAADDAAKAKANEGKQSSRYLFVMAGFDEKFLGQPPQKPAPPEEIAAAVEPAAKPNKKAAKKEPAGENDGKQKAPVDSSATPDEKPADKSSQDKSTQDEPPKDQAPKEQAAKTDAKQADADENCFPVTAADDDDADTKAPEKEETGKKEPGKEEPGKEESDKKGTDKKESDKPPEGDEPAADVKPQPAPKVEKKKSAEELKKEYDAQLKKYEFDLKAHQDKVAAGKKQAEELNARFAAWYYVISADNYNKLHLSRKELVKEKAQEKTKSGDDKKPGDDKETDKNPDEDGDEPVKDPLESLDEDDEKPEKKPE